MHTILPDAMSPRFLAAGAPQYDSLTTCIIAVYLGMSSTCFAQSLTGPDLTPYALLRCFVPSRPDLHRQRHPLSPLPFPLQKQSGSHSSSSASPSSSASSAMHLPRRSLTPTSPSRAAASSTQSALYPVPTVLAASLTSASAELPPPLRAPVLHRTFLRLRCLHIRRRSRPPRCRRCRAWG